MSDREDARHFAREDCARELKKHKEMHGHDASYDKCYREISERADVQDKRRDWNEHRKESK